MANEREQEIAAAVLRRPLRHPDSRRDVQNIERIKLAGFCRKRLAKRYPAAAAGRTGIVDCAAARERIYAMPYAQWEALRQRGANAERMAACNGARRARVMS